MQSHYIRLKTNLHNFWQTSMPFCVKCDCEFQQTTTRFSIIKNKRLSYFSMYMYYAFIYYA